MGTIALIVTIVALALWFKTIGDRHDRAFAEQQARLNVRLAAFQRQQTASR